MEIKIENYGTTGVGRIRVTDEYNIPAALIHFGHDDMFKTQDEAVAAAKAIIETYNKIQKSKTIKA